MRCTGDPRKRAIEVLNRNHFIAHPAWLYSARPPQDARHSDCTLPSTRELTSERPRVGLPSIGHRDPLKRLGPVVAREDNYGDVCDACSVHSVNDAARIAVDLCKHVLILRTIRVHEVRVRQRRGMRECERHIQEEWFLLTAMRMDVGNRLLSEVAIDPRPCVQVIRLHLNAGLSPNAFENRHRRYVRPETGLHNASSLIAGPGDAEPLIEAPPVGKPLLRRT
mmetsp:Transcript_96462/g.249860  ORF Transcript_96462/g.249860 Transcript_96462/m.249860 type:complete len:223 (+) Transcript_96462:532-1200(+)|eukprot:CAMPEP_0115399454 /NCGR_PEP_ID=MMETSP0271-20121206/14845_1 /TAXON_ID=71861 /ORGANISM="Scrippsiella trochoidea, Strain CCMP3099" /LENGTH=222 /DNA_ID=CAMNT_0002823267 /DNA_START=201 /DNA_END=869 /DNA_ORIENTATION=-